MEKKYLIVYFSRTGKTKQIAEYLQKELNADCEEIKDKTKYNGIIGYLKGIIKSKSISDIEETKYDVSNYDEVIIMSPIWAYSVCPAIRSYIKKNSEKIKGTSLITVAASSGSDGAKEELNSYNLKISNVIPINKKTNTDLQDVISYFKK